MFHLVGGSLFNRYHVTARSLRLAMGTYFEGADTQQIDGILQDYYEDRITEGVPQRMKLKELWKYKTLPFGGREKVWSAHVGRNSSPMFVGEDSAIAEAGSQQHIQMRAGQRKLMGKIRLTYEAMADSMRDEASFAEARKNETDGLIKDLARRIEHAMCSDGRGVLAHVDDASPTTGTTLTLDNPGGITNDNFGNRFISPGMYVGLVNPATGQLRASSVVRVLAAAASGASIDISAAPSNGADNDLVVQCANGSVTDILDTSYEHAFWGLIAHVDDGTYRANYFGADRTQFTNFASYVKAGTGAFSVDLLQQVSDILDQKLDAKVEAMIAHHSTRRLYLNSLAADRRYSNQHLKTPDAGTVAFRQGDITMGEVPIHTIPDWPLDMLMLLNKSDTDWVCYESEPGKWVNEDGRILRIVGSGSTLRDAFEALYRMRKQFVCHDPGKQARLDAITGQSLVVVRRE